MKAAIVILSDYAVQNFARRVAVQMSIAKDFPFYAAVLPAHVSLKQGFSFEDLERLDTYTRGLAASIQPFEVRLDRFYLFEQGDFGVLGLSVVETPILRGLHNRLNAELAGIFKDTRAAHDGEDYRFHLTIEIAREAASLAILRETFAAIPDKTVDLRFTARELGVFFYPDDNYSSGSFVLYKALALGGNDPAP